MTDSTDDYRFGEDYSLAPLVDDCKLLGSLLDDALKSEVGEQLFSKMERIRALAQCAATLAGKEDAGAARFLSQRMAEELRNLPLEEAIPLTRAMGHYLSLTGIAELHHRVRRARTDEKNPKSCEEVFERLVTEGTSPDDLYNEMVNQTVEIVLTAHPTQVNRRTLQYKHSKIAQLLQLHDRQDLTAEERDGVLQDLLREITSLWQTDELRRQKPSPVDEARGGLHVVEQSLWAAVPAFLRRLSGALKKHTGRELPLNATPIKFGSWMGGDRDGNPNVTAKTTAHVVALSRWMAADLYLREVDILRFELSMNQCSAQMWRMAKDLMEAGKSREEAQDGNTLKVAMSVTANNALHPDPAVFLGDTGALRSEMPADIPHELPGQDPEGGSEIDFPMSTSAGDSAPISPSASTRVSVSDGGAPALGSAADGLGGSWDNLDALRAGSSRRPADGAGADAFAAFAVGGGDAAAAAAQAADLGAALSSASLVPPGLDAHVRRMVRSTQQAMLEMRSHQHVGFHPYRVVLGEVRRRLMNTRRKMEEMLSGSMDLDGDPDDWYAHEEDLAQALVAVYWSLWECGGGMVADGRLLDLIRRVYCFGMALLKLDIRQESTRHTEALDAITTHLGYGSYKEWSEAERLEFLTRELETKRPLIPATMPMSADVKEVLDTFRMVARLGGGTLGAYVISMAQSASDVLAVELLQKEARMQVAGETQSRPDHSDSLRVVPLFETLTDLDASGEVMTTLFANPWYRSHLSSTHGNHQEVMLGYSDSGKDAGRLAANWALYRCQEQLVSITKGAGVRLTLFHGRGGTVGRGGGPTYLAIQSQAPGSVEGTFRITEQGEMVQAKFGIPVVAQNQLELYTTAVLLASLKPPNPPRVAGWTDLMNQLSETSCREYRGVVFQDPHFIPYFTHATPEAELGNLNIGSRPARRKKGVTVQGLRAIPWIFAWTQTRLILPSWLGIGEALAEAFAQGKRCELQQMYEEWPFFQATIDLIEMILAKADMRIAALYEDVLVTAPEEKKLGAELRARFAETVQGILEVTGHHSLLERNTALKRLIEMRNPYIDPLNIMQVEVLRRLRNDPNSNSLRTALLLTINGVAAGMRNTG